MRTESRWNKKLVSLSSPDWVESLRPSLDKNAHPWLIIIIITSCNAVNINIMQRLETATL